MRVPIFGLARETNVTLFPKRMGSMFSQMYSSGTRILESDCSVGRSPWQGALTEIPRDGNWNRKGSGHKLPHCCCFRATYAMSKENTPLRSRFCSSCADAKSVLQIKVAAVLTLSWTIALLPQPANTYLTTSPIFKTWRWVSVYSK